MLYERSKAGKDSDSDETDHAPPEDVASIETISTESLVMEEEKSWFNDEVRGQPEQRNGPAGRPPRFKRFAKNIGIQHMVLTKLHKRQASQRSPAPSLPATVPFQSKFQMTANKVLEQGSLLKSASYVSSINIENRHGSIKYLQFAPDTPHLAITWLVGNQPGPTPYSRLLFLIA